MIGIAAQLLALSRVREWIFSKLSFALVAILLFGRDLQMHEAMAVLATIVALGAFGYGINEMADRPADERAGKKNRARGMAPALLAFYLAATACSTLAAAFIANESFLTVGVALFYLVVAWQYSYGPLRLKERGIWGIVAAALAQWTAPIAIIFSMHATSVTALSAVCFAVLCSALGVRWMGVHQYKDLMADRMAGVRTFVSMGGGVTKLVQLSFVMELVCVAASFVLLWPDNKLPMVALLFWSLTSPYLLPSRFAGLRKTLMTYCQAPLGAFYFRSLPLALCLQAFAGWGPILSAALSTAVARLSLLSTPRRRPLQSGRSAPRHFTGIDDAPRAAFDFLQRNQRDSGELVVYRSLDRKITDPVYVRCVFGTALACRVLQQMKCKPDGAGLFLEKSLRFLVSEREEDGTWRFFAKGSVIPSDADDTAYCLLALGPSEDRRVLENRILPNRDESGLFQTWFIDRKAGPPYRNRLDAVVNANICTLLSERRMKEPIVGKFLKEHLSSGAFLQGSYFYPSPFFFLYAVSGCFPETGGDDELLHQSVSHLITNSPEADAADLALAGLALKKCRGADRLRLDLKQRLLDLQAPDGGWPASGLFTGTEDYIYWYGSRELTTAFCLGATADSPE